MVNIIFNGGWIGNEALCDLGRNVMRQLAKKGHKVKIDAPKPKEPGVWSNFYNAFKGKEDFYLLNGHPRLLHEIAKEHKSIISICIFETTLPDEWVKAINIPEVKQVWTISEFCKEMIIESGVKKPIEVISMGVDERIKKIEPIMFLKDESFKFLNVSAPHCLGTRDRKGLDVLIKAFKQEFRDSDKVTLILKLNTIYADRFNKAHGRDFMMGPYIRELIPDGLTQSNISVISDYIPNKDWLNNIYNSVDCGVFSFRSEGLCMPAIEMMKIGKPVICSNFSAPNEFSNPRLRIKIDRMLPLDYNLPPYYNSLFAEPDVENLRKLLREVYTNYEEHSKEAEYLRVTVDRFNWDQVGKNMDEILKRKEN